MRSRHLVRMLTMPTFLIFFSTVGFSLILRRMRRQIKKSLSCFQMRIFNFLVIKLTLCLLIGILLGHAIKFPLSFVFLIEGLLLTTLCLRWAWLTTVPCCRNTRIGHCLSPAAAARSTADTVSADISPIAPIGTATISAASTRSGRIGASTKLF